MKPLKLYKIPFTQDYVSIRRFRYQWRVGKHSSSLPYGLLIEFWEAVPDQEKIDNIKKLRRKLSENPSIIAHRYTLANSLRMAGRLSEARAEYEIIATSDDDWMAVSARDVLEAQDVTHPHHNVLWSKHQGVSLRVARCWKFAPFRV